ncbi:MAG TPA: ADOP family duplicated permease [Gemmatimonadaceae bacterium]|nr:ADOP family duplicated permease [Gemmatimonadaceae bacterium]
MEQFLRDSRQAIRALARSRGFSAAAILTLAVGMGSAAAIAGAAKALLWQRVDVPRPERLVDVHPRTSDASFDVPGFTYTHFRDLRQLSRVEGQLAASADEDIQVAAGGTNAVLPARFVSANYFRVLGVRPALGRFFGPEEENSGRGPTVVLSYALWQRTFGGDSAVIGRSVLLNWQPAVVVGVARPAFHGPAVTDNTDLWVPLPAQPLVDSSAGLLSDANPSLHITGRLAAGRSIADAQREWSIAARRAEALHSAAHSILALTGVTLTPTQALPASLRAGASRLLVLFLGLTLIVLLIGVTNVAGMFLVRASSRSREIAIRVAVGAGRGHIVRQLVMEGVLLSLAAGILGAVLAAWFSHVPRAMNWHLPVDVGFGFDAPVLLFAIVLSSTVGVAAAAVPAWRASKPDLISSLRDGQSTVRRGGFRWRMWFVMGQITASTVLLAGAALFLRALQQGSSISPGFDPRNVVTVRVDLSHSGYGAGRQNQIYADIQDSVEVIQGVRGAAVAAFAPLTAGGMLFHYGVEGVQSVQGAGGEFLAGNAVGPDFFRVLHIPLLRGRFFTPEDRQGAPRVAIVNEAFARRYWPGQNPIGKALLDRFGFRTANTSASDDATKYIEVVGLVPTGSYETVTEAPKPYVFVPLAQSEQSAATVLVRTDGTSPPVLQKIGQMVQAVDPRIPQANVAPLTLVLSEQLLPQRIAVVLSTVFGIVGILLTAAGIYGAVAYSMFERTAEIGVRLALGARPQAVLAAVLFRQLSQAGIAVAAGLIAVIALTPLARRFVLGIRPLETALLLLVPAVLLTVTFIAVYIPLRRIHRIDPARALRAGG